MKETPLLPKVIYVVEKVSAVPGKSHPAVVRWKAPNTTEVRYALVVFTTRERAAAWIGKCDDPDQWKIHEAMRHQMLGVLKECLANGIGWLSLDDLQGPDEVTNIFGLLVAIEEEE
jgi:hypothetical protein